VMQWRTMFIHHNIRMYYTPYILSEFSTANTDVYIFFGIFPLWINIWTAMDTSAYKCWCTDARVVPIYNVQSWRECDRREERKERIYVGAKSRIERERVIGKGKRYIIIICI